MTRKFPCVYDQKYRCKNKWQTCLIFDDPDKCGHSERYTETRKELQQDIEQLKTLLDSRVIEYQQEIDSLKDELQKVHENLSERDQNFLRIMNMVQLDKYNKLDIDIRIDLFEDKIRELIYFINHFIPEK